MFCLGIDICLRLFEKLRYFSTFDRMSEIRSTSAGRPNSQGVCPPLSNYICPLCPGTIDRPRLLYYREIEGNKYFSG